MAGFRATPASVRADAAMLHLRAVFLTRRAAAFACLDTCAELRASEFEVSAREPRHDACGGETDVGAIVAIANALNHLRHILFAETSIGACVAGFRAGIAGGNAFDDHCVIR